MLECVNANPKKGRMEDWNAGKMSPVVFKRPWRLFLFPDFQPPLTNCTLRYKGIKIEEKVGCWWNYKW
jgi:hypothetical protein